ncbi:MAG: hypothetical protein ACYTG0_10030 [Planctomycetota bacterium]|jgi:hypothetical protein
MEKRLNALAILTVLPAVLAASAFGQRKDRPKTDRPAVIDVGDVEDVLRERFRHTDRMILIDDVDRDAQRKAGAKRPVKRIQPGPAARAVKPLAVKRIDAGPVGRYLVSASDGHTILLDTVTGKTWLLLMSPGRRHALPAWAPIDRIDDREEAIRWMRQQEEMRGREIEELRRKAAEQSKSKS